MDILCKIKKRLACILKVQKQGSLLDLKAISRDRLKLQVGAGNRMKLYFKGIELTKSAGFSCSVLSDGVWYSLSGSRIKIRRIAQNKMGLFIKFKNIPFIQHWIIELGLDNHIDWNMEIETERSFKIDAVRVSVLFSKYYVIWFDAKAQENRFPCFAENQKVCYEAKELDFIGLKADSPEVPSMIFKAEGSPFSLTIQNTSIERSSRVIELEFLEEKELYQPGIYPYFKASFQLYPDKTVLEGILNKIRLEEERRIQEEERKRQEEENRRRLEEEWEKHEERLRRLQEKIKKVYVEPSETT